MKHIHLIIILLILFCSSCKTDKTSKLFNEHLKSEYNLEISNTETTFIIYSENGCHSCNKEIEQFLDNNNLPENCILIYKAKYPNRERFDRWSSKFAGKLYLDRTEFFSNLQIDLNGSGKIVVIDKKIAEIKTFSPQENDFETFLTPIL